MKNIRLSKIHISFPFVLLIAALYALDFGNVFIPTFIAVIVHETSHILATRLCGGTISSIDVRIFGIRAEVPELEYMSYKREIIIAAAGPLAGILTALCAAATAKVLGNVNLNYFTGINIVISAINLIPVYPLDGGRIVLATSLSLFSLKCAYVVSRILSILAVLGLFSLCIVLAVFESLNPSLIIFSIYIAVCGIKFRSPL